MLKSPRAASALLIALAFFVVACGSSSTPTTPTGPVSTTSVAVVALTGLQATVEPITMPQAGCLYRLLYQVRETGGKTGATLVSQHIALSNGLNADGTFTGPGVLRVPRVPPNGTITIESTLSVLTTAAMASHVVFSVGYTDDNGRFGSATVEADISVAPPSP